LIESDGYAGQQEVADYVMGLLGAKANHESPLKSWRNESVEFEKKLSDAAVEYMREAYLADPDGVTFHKVNERFEDGARWAYRELAKANQESPPQSTRNEEMEKNKIYPDLAMQDLAQLVIDELDNGLVVGMFAERVFNYMRDMVGRFEYGTQQLKLTTDDHSTKPAECQHDWYLNDRGLYYCRNCKGRKAIEKDMDQFLEDNKELMSDLAKLERIEQLELENAKLGEMYRYAIQASYDTNVENRILKGENAELKAKLLLPHAGDKAEIPREQGSDLERETLNFVKH
jgi:hypothetical protein